MTADKRYQYLGFNDRWYMLIGILVLAMITTLLFSNTLENPNEFIFSYLVSMCFTIMNWVSMRFIMIRLRKKFPDISDSLKRNVIYFFTILGVIVLYNEIGELLLRSIFGPSYHGPDFKGNLVVALISIMVMAIYEAIYYLSKIKEYIVKEEKANQVLVQSQLDTLRNQAQPHFFFNSLNTLRDIIETDSKKDATRFVDRLADVYRFILETGKANIVTVEEEMAFAKSYLYVQSERFGNNLKVVWDIPKGQELKRMIPMSLQLLLENAIKHNVISKAKPLEITISSKDDEIAVTNNLQPKTTMLSSTKIGLSNIVKRYELLGQEIPKIEKTASYFRVVLPFYQE